MTLEEQIKKYYDIRNFSLTHLTTFANYAVAVTTPEKKFALKLYNPNSRTAEEIKWEMDLTMHLIKHDTPVAEPIRGKDSLIHTFYMDGEKRIGVLFAWAPGEKPKASSSTYILLGKSAAQIHQAADSFVSSLPRERYGAQELLNDQLDRMKASLQSVGEWGRMYDLATRMKSTLTSNLDYGICHMDLTLDNVHRLGDEIKVFDLDSAGESWRALEPYGVLLNSEAYLQNWLDGYRSVRAFNKENEHAVYAFAIIGEIRNVVWKLGLAKSSRGKPLITKSELPKIIDDWLAWEKKYLQ